MKNNICANVVAAYPNDLTIANALCFGIRAIISAVEV